MSIKEPQRDLPAGLRGGSDGAWDDPQASVILTDEFFAAAAPAGVTGTLAATESGSDTFAATGGRAIVGTMAASESVSDTATSLLLNFEGANGSTAFVDESVNPKTIQVGGNAQISTAQSKFGSASMLLDGSTDWIYATPNADFNFPGDFTIELFARWNAITNAGLFHLYPGTPPNTLAGLALGYDGTAFQVYANGANNGRTASISTGVWYHLAVVRQANQLRFYLNGVQQGAAIADSTNYLNNGLNIGLYFGSGFTLNGNIDSVRVKKGEAVYTADFTPPTAPFVANLPSQDGFAATGTVGGAVTITGTLAATESGSDSLASTGTVQVQGTLAVTESGSDTLASTGTVQVSGALAATEAGSDTMAAAGVVTVAGSLNATEGGPDTLAATGAVQVQGTMAASEVGSDTFMANGSNQLVGSMAAQEVGSDTMAASGTVAVSGSMAAAESGADTMASTGAVRVAGDMAATEAGSDSLAATGTVTGGDPITGTMSAVEGGPDIFTAIGTIPGASPVNYYGSGKAKPSEPVDLVQLVREKWQAIEQARQRDAQRQPKAERQATQAQPAPQIKVEQAAMEPIASPFDDQTKAQRDAAAEEEQQIMAALALVMLDE